MELNILQEGALKRLYKEHKRLPEYAWVHTSSEDLVGTSVPIYAAEKLCELGLAESRMASFRQCLSEGLRVKTAKKTPILTKVIKLATLIPLAILFSPLVIWIYGWSDKRLQFRITEAGIEEASRRERIAELASDLAKGVVKAIREQKSIERMKW